MDIREKAVKADRIELRVTPRVKALLTAAARFRHTTVSEFLLDHGIRAAEREITAPKVFFATQTGWAAVQRLLDENGHDQPDDATISWLAKPGQNAK